MSHFSQPEDTDKLTEKPHSHLSFWPFSNFGSLARYHVTSIRRLDEHMLPPRRSAAHWTLSCILPLPPPSHPPPTIPPLPSHPWDPGRHYVQVFIFIFFSEAANCLRSVSPQGNIFAAARSNCDAGIRASANLRSFSGLFVRRFDLENERWLQPWLFLLKGTIASAVSFSKRLDLYCKANCRTYHFIHICLETLKKDSVFEISSPTLG